MENQIHKWFISQNLSLFSLDSCFQVFITYQLLTNTGKCLHRQFYSSRRANTFILETNTHLGVDNTLFPNLEEKHSALPSKDGRKMLCCHLST